MPSIKRKLLDLQQVSKEELMNINRAQELDEFKRQEEYFLNEEPIVEVKSTIPSDSDRMPPPPSREPSAAGLLSDQLYDPYLEPDGCSWRIPRI